MAMVRRPPPDDSQAHGGYGRRAIRTLLPYLWPGPRVEGWKEMRVRVVIAMILLVCAKVAIVYVPQLYRLAVDGLTAKPGQAIIAVPIGILVAYGVLRVLSVAFGELRDAVFAKVAHRAIRTVALETFRHLHGLALRFHLDRQTGGLTRAIERGTKGIEFLLSFMLFNIIPTLVEIFLVCGILWAMFDIWFALVTLVTVVGYVAYSAVVTEWRLKYRRQMNQSDEEANTKAIDSLLNYETVKYFNNEQHEASRYDSALRRYERASVVSKSSLSLLNIGQGFIIATGLTLIMYMAGRGVANGTMTVGDFVMVNAYLLQLYQPLNFLGFVYRQIKQSLVDMERMFGLLEVHREVQDKPGAPDLAVGAGVVRFEHVDFRYEERRSILHDVSFEVPAGNTVAIVGPSGAGKSTISRILFRFYDVEGGRVTIDGQDIRDVTQGSLRRAIGIVPQDTVLFNDTIRYNIAYGRPGASPDEIEHAAKLAQLHDFVTALPDGYETMVGERGLKLSGGEKQRVAIARTILKEPKILLFDEATSALDTNTEREIQRSLRAVSVDRTTLVIAHRLSTVIDADTILVLDHGRIVERGRHQDLLDRDGVYAEMWRKQQESARALELLEPEDVAGAQEIAEFAGEDVARESAA
jgi:ABC-type transport system involved in Fe-S cluster assembly fused permease/ATPase subunit